MKKDKARREIILRFQKWVNDRNIDNPTGTDVLLFYNELDIQQDPVLNFRAYGDKYQTVKAFLVNAGISKE